MVFDLIYWTSTAGKYVLVGSLLEKTCGKIWKKLFFSGRSSRSFFPFLFKTQKKTELFFFFFLNNYV